MDGDPNINNISQQIVRAWTENDKIYQISEIHLNQKTQANLRFWDINIK